MNSKVPNRLSHYDFTLPGKHPDMYDRLPYKRDSDLCNQSTLALLSGNVVKYFHCCVQAPKVIGGRDNIIEYKNR